MSLRFILGLLWDADFFVCHLWPIILAFVITLNEVLNAGASSWWLLLAPVAMWVVWQVGAKDA